MTWYEAYMKDYFGKGAEANKEFYAAPSTKAIAPFRIADDLYYVGDRKVCIHLIRTDEGLILIDAGYPRAKHLIWESIIRLGFDPADVRWILLTHGHSDHYGAANEFRNLYGTKVAISAQDAEYMREQIRRGRLKALDAPVIDRELQDGEIFAFGGKELRCVLTPGHTPGVMTFFMDVTDGGKTYRAGLLGGVGHMQVKLPYLLYYALPLDMPQRMLASLDCMEQEKVEIHLGNHPANNHTLEKREQQLKEGGNPFIDPASWGNFIRETRAIFEQVIVENEEMARQHPNE